MVASVYSYYALLPGQLDAAYARLTPRFKQDHTPTFASYQSFWGQMSAVRVSDVAATGSNTVSATVDYTYQTGRQQSERQVYGMVDVGGQWLFDTQH
jgi:hypothetical protein